MWLDNVSVGSHENKANQNNKLKDTKMLSSTGVNCRVIVALIRLVELQWTIRACKKKNNYIQYIHVQAKSWAELLSIATELAAFAQSIAEGVQLLLPLCAMLQLLGCFTSLNTHRPDVFRG